MAESFLEEQLKRIRKMSEQVSRVRPLAGVGDRRVHRPEEGAAHEGEKSRRNPGREPSRRRGL